MSENHAFTNKLIHENSPYLLSHAHNPVDWYPWGEEALNLAKKLDKPIFLSIGYAACHWCHVMEHESFENEAIAELMNQYFVCIKVDREQRPDLDEIYMTFTQAMTGHGGWPMSVFLTPDLKPFYAGTYFPPTSQYGRPGFTELINEIGMAYQNDKEQIVNSADNIYEQMKSRIATSVDQNFNLTKDFVKKGTDALMANFDHANGGFGGAPKFPHAIELSAFLRRYHKSDENDFLRAAEKALNGMADGGIYDHLGGGFARYSTDANWLVPHFEKMLYDNALLVPTYIEAYQLTGNEYYLKVVRETLDFVLREMTDNTGGFYSALDADSEGEEGKFYVWSKKEIETILGKEDAKVFCEYYNVTEQGNFEGHNILHLTDQSYALKDSLNEKDFNQIIISGKKKLFQERSQRIRPLTDDKILTSWNGLMLSAFCKGYQITGEKRYLDAAVKNGTFIKKELFKNNKLTHAYRESIHSDGQFLEDYAFYIRGLLDLFETDKSEDHHKWAEFAIQLANNAKELFIDDKGRMYLRPDNIDDLILRPSNETDGAIPAPGSFMISNWIKINRITGDNSYLETAYKGLNALEETITRYPGGMTTALLALDYYLNDKVEVVIVGKTSERDDMLSLIYSKYMPDLTIAFDNNGRTKLPLFEGRAVENGKTAAYLCVNSTCKLPVETAESLKKQIEEIN